MSNITKVRFSQGMRVCGDDVMSSQINQGKYEDIRFTSPCVR